MKVTRRRDDHRGRPKGLNLVMTAEDGQKHLYSDDDRGGPKGICDNH